MERQQFTRLKPLAVFFAVYTAGFLLFAATLKYTFPFVAGLLLALIVQPLIRLMRDRLHFRPGIASAVATVFVFAVLFGILFLLGYWLIYEINNLINYLATLSQNGFGELTGPINSALSQIGNSLSKIDANFIQQNQQQIMDIAKNGAGVATTVLSTVLKFLTSLPAIFTMLIVMIFSTYFFSKDMNVIKNHVLVFMPRHTAAGLKTASRHGANMSGRYVLSYLLVYFITFIETLIVFSALGVPYPLVISIITGIADVLPVLGPGTIYIPLALFYLVTGSFFKAGALLVCWLLITAIRQVIEPKLVSSSINIHPLFILAAIYFALIAENFWVLIYFSLLAILYQVLTQVNMLPKLFESSSDKPAKSDKPDKPDKPQEEKPENT